MQSVISNYNVQWKQVQTRKPGQYFVSSCGACTSVHAMHAFTCIHRIKTKCAVYRTCIATFYTSISLWWYEVKPPVDVCMLNHNYAEPICRAKVMCLLFGKRRSCQHMHASMHCKLPNCDRVDTTYAWLATLFMCRTHKYFRAVLLSVVFYR